MNMHLQSWCVDGVMEKGKNKKKKKYAAFFLYLILTARHPFAKKMHPSQQPTRGTKKKSKDKEKKGSLQTDLK